MPQPRRTPPKSKYTADRLIPGSFEGETVTRRRLMGLAVHGGGGRRGDDLHAARARLRGRLGAVRAPAGQPGRRSARPATSPTTRTCRRSSPTVQGIGEVGKTTVYVRAYNPDIDGPKDPDIPGGGDFIALSTRCMHLGCPVRFVEASERFICPCHGGVYDFTGSVSGGPPVRPLDRFFTRVRGRPGRDRPALLGQLGVQALPELPRSGAGPRRHRPVPLPGALLDAQARLMPKLPLPCRSLQPQPKRPGEVEEVKRGRPGQGGRHPCRRLGRRADVAVGRACGG